MTLTSIDHIVLVADDIQPLITFYRDHLGAKVEESRPGKFELIFGDCKVSLQSTANVPVIAHNTKPGTANVCFATLEPMPDLCARLVGAGVEQVSPLQERDGAVGKILSAHFRDPAGNLIELGNRL